MIVDDWGRDFEAVTTGRGGLPVGRRTAPRRLKLRLRRWSVHSSGRFDRPLGSWVASLRRLRALGSVITGTEAAGRNRSAFASALAAAGWDFVHLSGAAQGECYATWDAEIHELAARPFARQLTNKTWVRSEEYGGGTAAFVHALVVPLRPRLGVRRRTRIRVVVHMPLDNTRQRAAVWVDVCRGLVALDRDLRDLFPGADVEYVGDWNKNLRIRIESGAVERHLERPLKARASWRGRMPTAGTHGHQVIDYAIARGVAACELVPDDASSDHRPFRYRRHAATTTRRAA